MKPRDIGILLFLSCLASPAFGQAIDDPCTAGKGPNAKDDEVSRGDCQFAYGDLDASEQDEVRAFSDEGRNLKELAIPTLDPDQQDTDANYLSPSHPSPQPDVPMPNWRQYTGVPNDDEVGAIPADASNIDIGPGFPLPTMPGAVVAPDEIDVTYVRTPPGIFPKLDPWLEPPGTNMLPTVTRPLVNDVGDEIPNTLPSSKQQPYELHDGDPDVTRVNPLSPIEDLRYVLENIYELFTGRAYSSLYEELNDDSVVDTLQKSGDAMTRERVEAQRDLIRHLIGLGTDIIEGNEGPASKVPGDRAYRGFPLLYHSGHNRVKCVKPVHDSEGNVIGGHVDVHQVWYGGRIQSDTMFLDFGWDYQAVERDADGNVVFRDKDGNVVASNEEGDPSIVYLPAADNGYGGRRCLDGGNPTPIPPNKPWTITYTVDALHGSRDDFSPTGMFFDCPTKVAVGGTDHFEEDDPEKACPAPDEDLGTGPVQWSKKKLPTGFAMDQSFFPMEDGTRTVFKIKMPPPMYYKLTYTWGWREHPPRAQAMENTHQSIPPHVLKPIVKHEFDTFGDDEAAAIAKISDLAPAKRMWRVFGMFDELMDDIENDPAIVNDPDDPESWQRRALGLLLDGRVAYLDWVQRDRLPSGFRPDENADLTMLFINNTMYGEFLRGGARFHDWRKRIEPASASEDMISGPTRIHNDNKLRVTLINADYFRHGYINVDFGGLRGWENQFKPSLKTGGAGSFFTFGRFYHRPNVVPGSISVAPATFELTEGEDVPSKVIPSVHRIMIEYNFEPSRRLRFYQFDPLHHDVAIYSIH